MANIFNQGYFGPEFKKKLGEKFQFHYFGTLGHSFYGTDTFPQQYGDKFEFYKYRAFSTSTAGTSKNQVELEEPKLLEPPSKPKRKREPKHRPLRDKDIEKLLDRYFNGKKNSV
jgi:hypothetical protein